VVAIASFLIYSGILSTLNILVVIVLVLLSCVNYYAVQHAQSYEHRHKDATATLDRQMDYVQHTANDSSWGKDIRLYGMSNWILAMRDGLLQQYTALHHKIRQRYFAAGVVNAFTLFLRDALAYGYLIWVVSTGDITVGNFVLYFGAIMGFSGFVGRIVGDINVLTGANLQMNDLRAFLDMTDSPDPEHPVEPPSGKRLSIEFHQVCFSYAPGSEPVLKDFSLTIGAGEKIALVGVNGAGKTTLVKLLCGFYTPDSGDILLNGIPIHCYRKKDLFTLFSVVFQDIFIAPFTVAENVSMRLLQETDLSRVDDCLQQAGLLDAIAHTPDKTHSYMLKAVMDGIVLSGGQQQKLLMARALYKNAPILILDEPTAALDPIAESETYAKFHELARDKTSIYISHRLASTRFCDKVVFLHNGMASEIGTHEELIDRGGQYARMYDMQSHYYQSERGDKLA
jgi:ABC-type multidrug transport system fused ATPase/permease subunit